MSTERPGTMHEESALPERAADRLAGLCARLEKRGIAEAGLKAEWLLAHVLGCRRLEWPLHRTRPLSAAETAQLDMAAARLEAGEPLQYVLGESEFMGHVLKTDRRALIPRPETEQLVEWVLADEVLWQRSSPWMADVGTGSGCIAVALAMAHPRGRYLAIDRSVEALALARENIEVNGMTECVELRCGDLLAGCPPGTLDAVISNPPYIAEAEFDALPREVQAFEPSLALWGGADGLDTVRLLVTEAVSALKPAGRLFLEMGETQGAAASSLLDHAGFEQVVVRKDAAGKERFVRGIKP